MPGASTTLFSLRSGTTVVHSYPSVFVERNKENIVQAESEKSLTQIDPKPWTCGVHLCYFLGFLIPFANLIAAFVIWKTKGSENKDIELHSRAALNFQLSFIIYSLGLLLFILPATISMSFFATRQPVVSGIIAVVYFILIFGFIILGTACILLAVMNAIRGYELKAPNYPYTLNIIKPAQLNSDV